MKPKGIVYLVGAGPGDAGLLTLHPAELLERADVVVHDALTRAAPTTSGRAKNQIPERQGEVMLLRG
jgi:siroheme synthase